MRGQDKEMTIPGKDFADALFSAWLGTKPVNATLKLELLGEWGDQTGMLKQKVDPLPGSDSTQIRPWCRSTMC